LLDNAPILYAPSATVLFGYCRHKAPSKRTGGLVLAYSGGLHHAEAEGQGVAGVLSGKLYTGPSADHVSLYKEADRYRFLHLACHGRFNPHFPLASGLVLADGTLDVLNVLQQVQLDAELVTLSGCETGQGALRRGDEMIGLVRAFMYAGTPSVLVSLWPVDDLSTCMLMKRFYLELTTQEGVAKAEALRRAQRYLMTLTEAEVREWLAESDVDRLTMDHELDRLRRALGEEGGREENQERPFAHPYYWAPFLLIGDCL
jgi:CHAT domain-containing protein